MHDYASLAWEGAERAVDEFFTDKPEAIIPLTDGGGSMAICKARSGGPDSSWLLQRRRGLVSAEWTSAGNGGLSDLLGEGWSGPEPWGVWGVGASHTIRLYLARPPETNLVVAFQTAAALSGTRDTQEIGVFAGGKAAATWTFTKEANHGERSVTIAAGLVVDGPDGPVVELTFHPSSTMPVNAFDISSKEDRTLGLALIGMRVSKGLG